MKKNSSQNLILGQQVQMKKNTRYNKNKKMQSFVIYKKNNREATDKVVLDLLNKKTIYIQSGDRIKDRIKATCNLIEEIQSTSVCLKFNSGEILKEIATVSFPKVQVLCLPMNKIQSLEKINKMSMPLLQVLILSENYIISIKDLRKSKVQNLKRIQLENNKIKDIEKLSQLNTYPLFQSLEIDSYELDKKVEQVFDCRFIAKLSTKEMGSLEISPYNEGINKNVLDTLKEKFIKEFYFMNFEQL